MLCPGIRLTTEEKHDGISLSQGSQLSAMYYVDMTALSVGSLDMSNDPVTPRDASEESWVNPRLALGIRRVAELRWGYPYQLTFESDL